MVSLQRSDYANAVIHFRRALEYHIMSVSETKLFNGEVCLFFQFVTIQLNNTPKMVNLILSCIWFVVGTKQFCNADVVTLRFPQSYP